MILRGIVAASPLPNFSGLESPSMMEAASNVHHQVST